jgi:hypothetical protein
MSMPCGTVIGQCTKLNEMLPRRFLRRSRIIAKRRRVRLLASKNSAAFSIVQDRQALAAVGSVCKHVAQYMERDARRGLCKLLRLVVDEIIGLGAKPPDPVGQ